jgi:hypothetical protein
LLALPEHSIAPTGLKIIPSEPRYMPPKRQVSGSIMVTALPTLGTSVSTSPANNAPACSAHPYQHTLNQRPDESHKRGAPFGPLVGQARPPTSWLRPIHSVRRDMPRQ